jgi:hypothetical protein
VQSSYSELLQRAASVCACAWIMDARAYNARGATFVRMQCE